MEKNRLALRYISPSSEAAEFKQSWKNGWKKLPYVQFNYVNSLQEKVSSVFGAKGAG